MAEEKNSLQENGELGPKMTKWTKEPSIRELKLDLENSKSAHDSQMLKINRWNDLLHVRGTAKPKKVKNRSSVQPKLIRRQAEWRYPALTEPFLSSPNLFQVKPTTFEDAEGAKQNALVLNHQFRNQLNRVKLVDDFVRSTVDEGTCILQVGWKRHTIMVDVEVPTFDHVAVATQEELDALQQALELKSADPRTFNENVPEELKAAIDYYEEEGEATVATATGETTTVKTEKILINQPTVEVRNPQNIWLDPSCEGDIDKAMFATVSFETNKAELKKEGKRYQNLDKVDWENNAPINEQDHATSTPETFQLTNPLRKKVVAYEHWTFHDIHDDGCLYPIVVTWIGNQIIRMEESPFPDDKLPFVIVPYLPVKRELYGEPDAELLEDNQAILGAVSRGLIDLLGRSANGQQGFAKGMLDPLNRRRYESGEDYEFNPNLTPAAGLIEHKYPEIPQSAMLMISLQNNEAEALTGVKAFSGGMSGEAYGDVAAGVRGILDAASKREMSILRRLAKGMSDVGRKIASMNAVFLSEEETIRVTNTEFVKVNREDLKGTFDFSVDISTAEIDNAKSQDLAFMLQTVGPNEDPAMRRKILAEIADLKRMPDFANEIRNYKPEPDPLAVKMQELEIEKLQMEIDELRSKAGLNDAKANETGAKADKTNLDYVEQETGTKHARDMDKQRGQAQGNMDLEISKAILKPTKENETPGDIEAGIGFTKLAKQDNEDLELQTDDDESGFDPTSMIPGDSRYPVDQLDPGVVV